MFMSTVVTLKQPAHIQSDPAVAAIENYWIALEAWRAADRRLKRLRKKLPEELVRRPRVRVSWLLRGKDNAGADIKEPIYAYSEWEIKERARTDCKSMLSFHAPLYSWFVDPTAKGGVRRGVDKRARERRPAIRAKYRAWTKEKLAGFRADKADLYERQRAAGWRQAVENEHTARNLVAKLRYRLQQVTPTTIEGAFAMMEIIYAAHRSRANSTADGSPYGLSDYYAARIARHAADFLKTRTLQDMKNAA
jgi:hypothetical protein